MFKPNINQNIFNSQLGIQVFITAQITTLIPYIMMYIVHLLTTADLIFIVFLHYTYLADLVVHTRETRGWVSCSKTLRHAAQTGNQTKQYILDTVG